MAAPTPAPRPSSDPAGVIPAEWPSQAADAIVDAIEKVRDKTTKPVITAARGAIYGMLIGVTAFVCLILVIALSFRIFANYAGEENLWIAYLGCGLTFVLGGAWAIAKANRPPAPES
jgi:hypothetical protein